MGWLKMFTNQQFQQFYRYAFSLCQHEADAFDLVQSSLEKYLNASNKQTIDYPEAFLRRILRNLFIDQCRRNKHWQFDDETGEQIDQVLELSSHNLEQMVIDENLLEHLWQQLNPAERELLYLWAGLGHSIDEIAQELQSPRGTLLARMHRLRKKLLRDNPDLTQQLTGGQS